MGLCSSAPTLFASGLLLLAGCPKGGQPSTVSRDGGVTTIGLSCGSFEHKVSSLYQEAAQKEGLALNLQSEFVSANLKMVMDDCALRPAVRAECLQQANNVTDIESKCLEFLDDQGTVEGYRFGGS